jgi:hypothetical protein
LSLEFEVVLNIFPKKRMDRKFEARTYGFGELAQLYFPYVTKASASRMFSLWIYKSPELVTKLTELNWKKREKYFTPKQVKALVDFFDPPY